MKTKLLFLCSANIDRSPCAEFLFENNERYEAKSAGLFESTENPITNQAVEWADIIFVMDEKKENHKTILLKKFPYAENKDIRILNIPNDFCRYDKELERLLRIGLEKNGIDIGLNKGEDDKDE